jgi:ribonuclease PH
MGWKGAWKRCAADGEVLVGIYGPVAPRSFRMEEIDRCTVEVSVDASSETRERLRHFEVVLQTAVEAMVVRTDFPRMTVAVTAHIVRGRGPRLESLLLNAASLALAEARVPVVGFAGAAHASVMEDEEGGRSVVLDPCEEDGRRVLGDAVVCVLQGALSGNPRGDVIYSSIVTSAGVEWDQLVDTATRGCAPAIAFQKAALKARVHRDIRSLAPPSDSPSPPSHKAGAAAAAAPTPAAASAKPTSPSPASRRHG